VPQQSPEPSHGVLDVRGLLDGLNDVPATWSDEVLEELSRLGEGAGGAVHKVKDIRTGKIMARKTITTREAPMKQLLRELSIISSTEHVNIILCHGAYMSPSSSEVKILMEFCEGGSLETVGKRIKDRGAIVGEKIAGRLAEGVSLTVLYSFLGMDDVLPHRFCKVSHICTRRRLFIGISNPPIYYYLARALSSWLILECPANLLIPMPARSRARVSTWLLVNFLPILTRAFDFRSVARANLRARVYYPIGCMVYRNFAARTCAKSIPFP
jgi:hypothetical protein